MAIHNRKELEAWAERTHSDLCDRHGYGMQYLAERDALYDVVNRLDRELKSKPPDAVIEGFDIVNGAFVKSKK